MSVCDDHRGTLVKGVLRTGDLTRIIREGFYSNCRYAA
jgi:hypothetical protein